MTKIYLGDSHPSVVDFDCIIFPHESGNGCYVSWTDHANNECCEFFDTAADAGKYANLLMKTWGLVEIK